jgi:hypothetical protein
MVALVVLGVLVTPAFGQSPPPKEKTAPDVVHLDSSLVLTPVEGLDALSDPFSLNTARPLTSYLATSADRFYGFRRYKLSRFDCALQGAGLGMKIGMIGAALGSTFGNLDEDTGWYIAGAAALLGAIWGGTVKAEDPEWNIQIRWEPPDEDVP